MRTRARLLAAAAALAAAAGLAPVASAAGRAGAPALPTLYVNYAMNCTFTIDDDAGNPVSSIAPGSYQVEVSTPIIFKLAQNSGEPDDFTGCKGWVQFQLSGPGVSLFTTLDSGCDNHYLLPATTFAPSSTYTAVDLNQPSVARQTFTTLAGGAPAAPSSPYGPGTGKGEASTDIVGSEAASEVAGTLAASLTASGRTALRQMGKPVAALQAGRYRFRVVDRDRKAGVTLRPVGRRGKGKTLTGVRFVGTRSVVVSLTPGRWQYSASRGARPIRFVVTRS